MKREIKLNVEKRYVNWWLTLRYDKNNINVAVDLAQNHLYNYYQTR